MIRYCTGCGGLLAPDARFCTNCGTQANTAPRASTPQILRRRLRLIPLVAVMFFSVSGGAFGIEPAVQASGAGLVLLLLVLVPIVWVLPVTLMVAELSSAIPAEGGYYVWVRDGLGRFWGFQEGWWSWADSFVDMAIYPVLFADYLVALLNRYGLAASVTGNRWAHWLVALAVIWVFALLNIRGVRLVGNTALLFTLLVLAPFAVMSFIGLQHLSQHAAPVWRPFIPEHSSLLSALGLGLFVVMWNYLGWDGPSTVSGEIVRPRSSYPWSLALAGPLVVLAYLLPVLAGLVAVPSLDRWREGAFPDIAAALAGNWLGVWLAVAALISAAGLFSALMLSNSRLPFVLADDGFLPQALTRLHRSFGTPWVSIGICAAIYSIFTLDSFADLVELDVIIYTAGLLLEFAALVMLRRRRPDLARPVRVPGGNAGLTAVCVAPVAVFILALAGTVHQRGPTALIVPAAILASGLVLYPVLSRLFDRAAPRSLNPTSIA
jgi:amino acid transporter